MPSLGVDAMATQDTESHDGTDLKTVSRFDNPAGFPCGTVLSGIGNVLDDPAHLDRDERTDPFVLDGEEHDRRRGRFGLCVDGSECGRSASTVVSVGRVEVVVCGGHVDDAAEVAARSSGVDLPEREPTTSAPESDDYDVSDTLEALQNRADEADDLDRCSECETPVVPDEAGHVCPSCDEPRSPSGDVLATDGGTAATGATTHPVPPKVRKAVTSAVSAHKVVSIGQAGDYDGLKLRCAGSLPVSVLNAMQRAGYELSSVAAMGGNELLAHFRPAE